MKTTIHIPTPCSEDWNKMTPTEKGAFCDKCAFEVIDFTKQSPEEIRDTLKNRMGQRTCGHISSAQLDMVNSNFHVWENQTISVFRSKFLYACLMVFGMSLFTGCSADRHDDIEGEIEEVPVGMVEMDTTASCGDDTMLIDGMIEEEVDTVSEEDADADVTLGELSIDSETENPNQGKYTLTTEVKGLMEFE